jgi:hypothetical protein
MSNEKIAMVARDECNLLSIRASGQLREATGDGYIMQTVGFIRKIRAVSYRITFANHDSNNMNHFHSHRHGSFSDIITAEEGENEWRSKRRQFPSP